MNHLIARAASVMFDALLPISCLGCGRQGRFLCDGCAATLPELRPPYCDVCAEPCRERLCNECSVNRLAVDGIRAAYLYEEGKSLVQKVVVAFKYRDMRAVAPELARLMAAFVERSPLPGEVIVPVPMHPKRLRSRGFNQAALLARELGKRLGLPVNESSLVRIKAPQAQVSAVSREDRRKNVAGNFTCTGRFDGTAVLLVDDIATTGSTMSACAQALKDAGASRVWGLAFARTP